MTDTLKACGCGRPIKTSHELCGQCRRNGATQPCIRNCGGTATHGNTICGDCRDAEEVERTKVAGWNRGPGGALVGSFKNCVGFPCTEHHFCENRNESAA